MADNNVVNGSKRCGNSFKDEIISSQPNGTGSESKYSWPCSIVKICVIDQVWIEVFDVHSIEVWDGDHDRNKEGDCQICEAQG